MKLKQLLFLIIATLVLASPGCTKEVETKEVETKEVKTREVVWVQTWYMHDRDINLKEDFNRVTLSRPVYEYGTDEKRSYDAKTNIDFMYELGYSLKHIFPVAQWVVDGRGLFPHLNSTVQPGINVLIFEKRFLETIY